ncbi:FkbM family methyltransferase (plasmid) [Rhizobium sp. CB3090]|uniref:FkbM family methyltransferase n=1 Tax=Rhizobium sp. CB3090 TaxID=3039156 RepID=UPI0024B15715|nr:FkbM family methyltransferase [Rhizobium sp. CB3090]WFU12164.1 FkbM family methyltransferase [Rhizobium sp. CB3090]
MDVLERTLMTIGCKDCEHIPKVANAGRIIESESGPVQIMHNGIKVVAGGYYGDWMAHVIRALRGHHEPQEELIFDSLLRLCRNNSLIVELGAFWTYYSLWYLHDVPGSRAICVEPDPRNRTVGEKNIALNGMQQRVVLESAWVGEKEEATFAAHAESLGAELTLPCFNMNSILRLAGDSVVEVLHIDAQGAELPFLGSMARAIEGGRVRFLVASTHHSSISGSKTTHRDCVEKIISLGGRILVEHDVQESFSGDGLIVASFFDQDRNVVLPHISRNTARHSLFPEL